MRRAALLQDLLEEGVAGGVFPCAAAAVLLSVLEGLITSVAEPTTARIISLILMSVVLLLRPQGIFARSTR